MLALFISWAHVYKDVRFKGAIAINMSSSNISKDLCGKFTGWEGCAIQLYKIVDTVNVGGFQ